MIIIDAYDENANYNIAFGDGISSANTKEKVEHTYAEPGNYTIELNVSYNDKPAKKIVKEGRMGWPHKLSTSLIEESTYSKEKTVRVY